MFMFFQYFYVQNMRIIVSTYAYYCSNYAHYCFNRISNVQSFKSANSGASQINREVVREFLLLLIF